MKLFVGCSSSGNIDLKYIEEGKKVLEEIFGEENELVFGVCDKGLMGLSYTIAKKNNNFVIGITPNIYKKNLEKLNCDDAIITEDIIESTIKQFDVSDALLFLPGGIGTIYELLIAIERKMIGELNKPIIIFNSFNYYDDFLNMLKKINVENFTDKQVNEFFFIAENGREALDYINNYYD